MERWQSKAILEINPNAEYNFTIGEDGSISEIDWKNNTTPISMEEINVKANEIKNREEYKFNRKNEYPSIKHQLDDIYHNGIDGWKDTIKAVKDKYPKEE